MCASIAKFNFKAFVKIIYFYYNNYVERLKYLDFYIFVKVTGCVKMLKFFEVKQRNNNGLQLKINTKHITNKVAPSGQIPQYLPQQLPQVLSMNTVKENMHVQPQPLHKKLFQFSYSENKFA